MQDRGVGYRASITLNLAEKRLKISAADDPMMNRLMSFVLWLGAVVAAGLAGPREPLWLDRTTGFPEIADLPMLRRGVQTHQFCSYDRAGDNYDHDYFPLYLEPDGQCVIFDAYGPGCLCRQQMNLWHLGVFPGDNASRKLDGVRIRYYFDGSRTPQVQGDGFEDDQGFGWGLKERSGAVYGAPVADGGSGSLYRFFIPDLYVFHTSVRHGHITYGPASPRGHEGMYRVGNEASVTYYYAVQRPTLVQTDEVDVGDVASETAHQFAATNADARTQGRWWYDGEYNNVLFGTPPISDDGRSSRGSCEFTAVVDPENCGVRLRRRTDKENNRQLARVFIDGVLVTERPWYTVDFERTYRDIRWADTDFDIPAKYTRGERSLRVRMEHAGSENGCLDAFRFWVFCCQAEERPKDVNRSDEAKWMEWLE